MKSLPVFVEIVWILRLPFVNLVKDRQVPIAANRKAHSWTLAQIAASLLVLPPLGDFTSDN